MADILSVGIDIGTSTTQLVFSRITMENLMGYFSVPRISIVKKEVVYYKSGKPAADKLKSIRFEKSRQKYKSEHDNELRTFYMAERKLKPYFKDGKLPITAWRREREQLEQEYKDIQTVLSPLHVDVKRLWAIHYNIYEVQHEQERQNAATRQKKQEIEH